MRSAAPGLVPTPSCSSDPSLSSSRTVARAVLSGPSGARPAARSVSIISATGATSVTDEPGVEKLFADADADALDGDLHAVVNTASISSWGRMIDHDVQLWRDVLDINLVGAFIVLKHAGRSVVDGGSLVSLFL